MERLCNEKLFTIDEIAQILNMHVKTVRGYLRDGKIKGFKIGGEWRIKESEFTNFLNREVDAVKNIENEKLKEFIDGKGSQVQGKIQACTILDVYVDSKSEAQFYESRLTSVVNGINIDEKHRYQYIYFENEKKARFTLWGSPEFISKVLNAFSEMKDEK